MKVSWLRVIDKPGKDRTRWVRHVCGRQVQLTDHSVRNRTRMRHQVASGSVVRHIGIGMRLVVKNRDVWFET